MFLAVRGAQTYLAEHGSGEPVLLLHGVPDSADMWNGVIPELERHFHCYTPDLPGLGRSTAPAGFACSLEQMADFTNDLVEAAHMQTPLNLVATDFGAVYGLAWAIIHPQKVRRIAIAGGVSFSPDYRWHANARMLRTPLLGDLAMATLTKSTFVRTMHSTAPTLTREHWRQVYELSMVRPTVRSMILRMYRGLDRHIFADWEKRLLALTASVPTLILWGDRDPFITPAYAHRFGAAQVEHFPEYGHWLAIEAPDVVARRLLAFFTACAA